jgi:glycosyltransferase involved in cell wall biosynthesis
MKISIIVPVYNEVDNLEKFFVELVTCISLVTKDYEIIAVNDGSSDGSTDILHMMTNRNASIKVIDFMFNTGQTAAMSAGIKHANGDVIIPMDADMQNDPNDIGKFILKISEGYDVVSGWRKDRKDDFLFRKVPSLIANWLIRLITGVNIHDYGCSMKAYRREMIQMINLYGEMHRFIPAYVAWNGGKVSEIIVNHRPRTRGKTKYGISRTFKVILDLIVIKFLSKYMNKPMHFFGGIGFISLFLGSVFGIIAIIFKLIGYRDFVATPLPIFSALFIIVGVQLIVIGVIAEMIMRVYFESQNLAPYKISRKLNF